MRMALLVGSLPRLRPCGRAGVSTVRSAAFSNRCIGVLTPLSRHNSSKADCPASAWCDSSRPPSTDHDRVPQRIPCFTGIIAGEITFRNKIPETLKPDCLCLINVALVATAAGLAVLGWLRLLNPYLMLISVFFIGVGFAFNAPA